MRKLFLLLAVVALLGACKKDECVICTEQHTGYVADEYCGAGIDEYEAALNDNVVGQVWKCERQ